MKKLFLYMGIVCAILLISYFSGIGIYNHYNEKKSKYTNTNVQGDASFKEKVEASNVTDSKQRIKKVTEETTLEDLNSEGNLGTNLDTNTNNYRYRISVYSGYVAIYNSDDTLYEVTDIDINLLTDEVLTEITRGKYYNDEESMYSYLESLSS